MEELLSAAVEPLLKWFDKSKRTLPWRGTKDPYRIWVSEIMLQQTRVEAAKDYYMRFLERFPTAQALADADEEQVLKAWEGLGYYSRARNLHKASKMIALGGFPKTFEGVRALPGVGDYTAGAICSIAYDLPCPAVDGNVLRILSRLFADERCVDDGSLKKIYAEKLKEVYPPRAGDFCQALMELGALVCLPNFDPMCKVCPWEMLCRAHKEGRETSFPVKNPKKERKIISLFVYVLEREGKFALRKRKNEGLLANLFELPSFEEEQNFGKVLKTKSAKHVFTHLEWHMTGYLVDADENFREFLWATPQEIVEKYPLPSAFKAYFEWIK